MKKYLMIFEKDDAQCLLVYNENDFVVNFELDGDLPLEKHARLARDFPWSLIRLEDWKKIPNVKVKEIEPDLSFEAFWNAYDYKHGKKVQCAKTWNKMSKVDRAAALAFIDRYNSHLATTKIQKQYPQTYLNARQWEN